MHITATTLEYSNVATGGTNNKFYRMYQADKDDTNLYLQYGSQNNGRQGGQFTVLPHKDLNTRDREFIKRLNEKRGEGYSIVHPETGNFEILDSDYQSGKAGVSDPKTFAKFIAHEYSSKFQTGVAAPNAVPRPRGNAPTPTPSASPITAGTLEALNDRLQAAIIAACSDPIEGYAQLAVIRLDLGALKAEVRKLEDYTDTLEMLAEEAL